MTNKNNRSKYRKLNQFHNELQNTTALSTISDMSDILPLVLFGINRLEEEGGEREREREREREHATLLFN